MDKVSAFGFVIGFFTLVALMYRRELRSVLPIFPILFALSAVYGFLQGAWPLGFVLVAVAASELLNWRRGFAPIVQRHARPQRRFFSLYEIQSQSGRMFEQR